MEDIKSRPFVSVVIPTYNRKEMLKECVGSLFTQTYPTDQYEIIVVDDGSTDETKNMFDRYLQKEPRLSYFYQENQGPSAARILGTRNSKGEIICFIDDDCVADRDWIKNLVDCYVDDNVGGVGGKIMSFTPKTIIERYCYVTDLFNQELFTKLFLMTGNASYKKNVLTKVRSFDRYIKYGEDVDLGIKVILAGYSLRYNSKAVVYHKHKETLKGLLRQKYRHGKGYACVHKKYPKNFSTKRRVSSILQKIVKGMVLYPLIILKSVFVKDKKFYLIKRLLDILLLMATSSGMINESLFGGEYLGQKIDQKLEFIEKANLSGGWGL